ncbi:MAG TPA: transglycosylase domain-containing protein [Acidimicrobiales bacterium]|nr:transglycosylase domain-containing protein [Acidimicrobiales bacterium]
MRRAVRVVVAAVLLAVGVPVLCGGTILAAFIFLPLPASLPPVRKNLVLQPSVVYDDQGNVIATFRQSGSEVPVARSDITPVIVNALISSEDHNFFNEGGVSIRGTLRALYDDVVHGQTVQGGSTITQQYVKNAYTGGKRTILRKIHEVILASEVSRQLSKSEILYRYLSGSYFGEGSYGIAAAAQTYFRTPASKLDASQAATLVGVLPAPSDYDPLVNVNAAESRRETVLGLMAKFGYLTPAQYQQALAQRLAPASVVRPGVPVTAFYPPPQEGPSRYPYFVDYLKRYLLQKLGPDEVFGGGLQIQSTLDPNDEVQAEAAVGRGLGGTSLPIDMALASVEPSSGYVKALVGGRDFNESQVNLALPGCPAVPSAPNVNIEVPAACWTPGATVQGGGTGFPGGSSFKVFTLAAALEKGISLDRTYSGPPSITIGGTTFHNAENEGGGFYNLRNATWLSINTVFVQLANDIGVKAIADQAKSMGVTSAWYSPQIHGLSYTLGVVDVSPLEMATAYAVLANQGLLVPPSPVVRVADSTGKILIDDTKPVGQRVMPANIASEETQVLEGVISHGTAYPNAVIGRPEAGKTGTTDNCTNAWFDGYTPQLSTSVWMGHLTSNTIGLRGVEGIGCVYGGTIPAKTWGDYMGNALKNVTVQDFAQPPPPPPPPPNVFSAARPGISAGYEQYPTDVGGGTYVVQPPPPNAAPPTTTTTSTTTTTVPGSGGGGAGPGPGGLVPPGGAPP